MSVRLDRHGAGRLAVAGLAQLVLAFATGLPLSSAEKLVPGSEDGQDSLFCL